MTWRLGSAGAHVARVPTCGLCVWLGLLHNMVAGFQEGVSPGAFGEWAHESQVEAAWSSITWPQKSHSITFPVLFWSRQSQACSDSRGREHRFSPTSVGGMSKILRPCFETATGIPLHFRQPQSGMNLEWDFWYGHLQDRTYYELWLFFNLTLTNWVSSGWDPVTLPPLQPLADYLACSKYLASELESKWMNEQVNKGSRCFLCWHNTAESL